MVVSAIMILLWTLLLRKMVMLDGHALGLCLQTKWTELQEINAEELSFEMVSLKNFIQGLEH